MNFTESLSQHDRVSLAHYEETKASETHQSTEGLGQDLQDLECTEEMLI